MAHPIPASAGANAKPARRPSESSRKNTGRFRVPVSGSVSEISSNSLFFCSNSAFRCASRLFQFQSAPVQRSRALRYKHP